MVIPGTIAQRVAFIREKIAEAAEKSGRSKDEILLAAVTKTRTVAEMLEAQHLVDAIGENRVQEALSKKSDKNGADWEKPWRMIGSLQKNKARKALEIFDTIDSVNSVELALTLQNVICEKRKKNEKNDKILPILIEVNTSEEISKTGISLDDVYCLVDTVLECDNLRLEGFMTIAPFTEEENVVRRSFAKLREVTETFRGRTGLPLPVISMGMSSDFHLAIREGSTLVRIGAALFGSRT